MRAYIAQAKDNQDRFSIQQPQPEKHFKTHPEQQQKVNKQAPNTKVNEGTTATA
jgi:hypothetical protein